MKAYQIIYHCFGLSVCGGCLVAYAISGNGSPLVLGLVVSAFGFVDLLRIRAGEKRKREGMVKP